MGGADVKRPAIRRKWATTRELADLLGRRDVQWLRDRLRLLEIPSRRLGRRGVIEWSVRHVLAVFPADPPA